MIKTDVIIIGKGPAGISAALYTKRANLETIILGSGVGALEKAHAIENYYGLESVINGSELAKRGVAQAEQLGCIIKDEEVVSITYDSEVYTVKTIDNQYQAMAVLLATGAARTRPPIKNIDVFEGKGVSYCAICDAFFYRQKTVAVIGAKEYALSEVKELLPLAKEVLLLTNGEPLTITIPENVKVFNQKILSIEGDNKVESILFDDNTQIEVAGVFIAVGSAGSSDFARKLGAFIENGKIVTDQNQNATLPGLYAAGDCTVGTQQIAKAVGEGCIAGLSMINYLRVKKK